MLCSPQKAVNSMETNHQLDSRVWIPLEKYLGSAEACGAFMYMGVAGSVYLYKNIISRRYLNIDSEGNCYKYDGVGAYVLIDSDGSFQDPVAAVAAVAELLPGLVVQAPSEISTDWGEWDY